MLPDGGFAYEFVVPFHAEAELMLENVQAEKLLVNGVAANEAGISIRQEGENILAALKAGRYQITCMSE